MSLRPIKALRMPDITPAALQAWKPAFRWVAPADLRVDEDYQRALTERSVTLIRRIVAKWDWASFKPPVCVEENTGALHVLDGQHTAIAAASHGGIAKIPVCVVSAASMQDRARAFVAHNRDRVAMTPLALHHGMVKAGDEEALTIDQVCRRAGVCVPRHLPQLGAFKPGDCIAVSSLRRLVRTRNAMGARRVLEICAAARLAPIGAPHIKAVDMVLFGDNPPTPEAIAAVLMRPDALALAKESAARQGIRIHDALAQRIQRLARRKST